LNVREVGGGSSFAILRIAPLFWFSTLDFACLARHLRREAEGDGQMRT
jgi:hypothetical protein